MLVRARRNISRRLPGSSGSGDPSRGGDDQGGVEGSNRRLPSSTSRFRSLVRTCAVVSSVLGILALMAAALRDGSISSSSTTSGGGIAGGVARQNKTSETRSGRTEVGSAAAVKNAKPRRPTAGLVSPATNATLHVVFSTNCSSYHHWQSYLFFHSAFKVQQPGYVTRIVSGCSDKELKQERSWHSEHIQSKMSDRFRIHFTPNYSGAKDQDGKVNADHTFINKPIGLKHWMENDKLLGINDSRTSMRRPDDIIILTDPDFLLLRPITDDFSSERETLVGARRKKIYQNKETHFVTHGNPYAQTYSLGTQWRKFDLDEIAGPGSPAKEVDQDTGGLYYVAGPPYIATAKDMHEIAVTWSEFAPRVYREHPHLIADAYAYCIAAAHLRLPHMLIDSLMISSIDAGGEGWKFVKDVPARELCNFASRPNHLVHPVPSAIHYRQHYAVDRYFWGKSMMPKEIFTCDHPPLKVPPIDLGSGKYPTVVSKGKGAPKALTAEKEKMESFMVCTLTKATNDAMAFFKVNAGCDSVWNTEKSYDMWAEKEVS